MNITEQLMRDEGFVPHAYQDSLGYWTIGFGRLIDERKGGGISREEAAILLRNDIELVRRVLHDTLPWVVVLDAARMGVLINMAFNLGVSGLLKFRKFLAAMESGDYKTAAGEMMDSLWAKQTGARATRLRDQVLIGEWR